MSDDRSMFVGFQRQLVNFCEEVDRDRGDLGRELERLGNSEWTSRIKQKYQAAFAEATGQLRAKLNDFEQIQVAELRRLAGLYDDVEGNFN